MVLGEASNVFLLQGLDVLHLDLLLLVSFEKLLLLLIDLLLSDFDIVVDPDFSRGRLFFIDWNSGKFLGILFIEIETFRNFYFKADLFGLKFSAITWKHLFMQNLISKEDRLICGEIEDLNPS